MHDIRATNLSTNRHTNADDHNNLPREGEKIKFRLSGISRKENFPEHE